MIGGVGGLKSFGKFIEVIGIELGCFVWLNLSFI